VFREGVVFGGMCFEEKNVEDNLRKIQLSACKLRGVFSVLSN